MDVAMLTCREPNAPVVVVELLLDDAPEDVRAGGQRDAMQQQRHAHLADVRVLGVAQVPQRLDQQVLLAPDEEAAMLLGRLGERIPVQRDRVQTFQRAGRGKGNLCNQ